MHIDDEREELDGLDDYDRARASDMEERPIYSAWVRVDTPEEQTEPDDLEEAAMKADAVPLTLDQRLERIESMLVALVERQKVKDWYSVEEVASQVGKAAFTVREWCRHGRILAQKRSYRRGKSAEWMISHEEVQRVQNQGLLPGHLPMGGAQP